MISSEERRGELDKYLNLTHNTRDWTSGVGEDENGILQIWRIERDWSDTYGMCVKTKEIQVTHFITNNDPINF